MKPSERTVRVIPATIDPKTRLVQSPLKKRRVCGYARVSTDKDEQFTSYEAQIDYYTKFIQRNPDWEFLRVYTDEGISGTNTKHRDGFNEMIADALAGKIDLIVTKSVSRFARNTVDSLTTIRMLKEKNVECFFEKENIYTFDGKGELLITIMSSLAQEESRSISENVTWGKRKSMSDGKVYMPYKQFLGYKRGEDGTPQIVEEEAATVRKIYDMFLQGDSIYSIANKLQAEGIKTPAGKKNWCRSVLRSILTNEKYKGCALLQKSYTIDFLTKKQVKNRGEVSQYYVEDSHPAIIEPEKWEMVQREMARRQESGPHYSGCYLFSSRIICGDCGGFYGPRIYNSNTKYRHTVWRCNHKYVSEGREEGKCETPGLKEDLIKCMFLEAVNEVIENRTEILSECRLLWKTYTKRSAMDEKIDALEKECGLIGETIRELVEKNAKVALDQESFTEKYNSCTKEYEEKNARLEELKQKKTEMAKKADALSAFMFELQERKNFVEQFSSGLWHSMVDIITVYNDGRMVFRFKNGKEITKWISKH